MPVKCFECHVPELINDCRELCSFVNKKINSSKRQNQLKDDSGDILQ